MQKLKIGFIGIGVMGKSMADNLLKAGYEVMVYTRTKQKAETLLTKGAKWFDSAKALAQNVDVIISMVGYPQDVAEIYLGENGVIKNLKPQSIIIDMTTSSPKLAQEIYQEASARLTFQNLCFLKQLCLKDSLHLSLSHYNRTHHKASWQSR